MTLKTIHLTDSLTHYLQKYSLREPVILKNLREKTSKLSEANLQISPEEGQLLSFFVELIGAKKVLEVGTFTGYSALILALALPTDGKVITCDTNIEWTNIAKQFWKEAGVAHKIELKIGLALDSLQDLINENETATFDFIFLDADKENYPHYYELSLKLLKPNGLIAIDNVLWDGKVADINENDAETTAIRKLNEIVVNDARVINTMIPIADGLTVVRKR